ncbi:hypothetical protein [Kitasatospora sp. CB01950]|uniref:hypothetical protein n=1 Tax=Kitasatospora sp. CB01950 TaxID=1703930 RepID=UPI000938955E|nr:hypothetical protein [Kitasatospora sp. CB01950]OKJ09294.1 hypothetical protein AMK19_18290 [Kitasatospora sp. CB01950]
MSTDYDSFSNRGEYFAAHYFAEQLAADLKKQLLDTWTLREGDEHDRRTTARERVRGLRTPYFGEELRGFFAEAARADAEDEYSRRGHGNPEWTKQLGEWHQQVLHALGYDDGGPAELTVHRAGRDHTVQVAYHGHGIVAVDCGWATDNDAALDPTGSGRLLHPLRVSAAENYNDGAALASWLFAGTLGGADGTPPRFVLLLIGGVLVLADRNSWGEGRYLAVNLDAALERNDRRQGGELATIAALFGQEMLRPGDNGSEPLLDTLLKASSTNAVGVSGELRSGLQRSVEIIAQEVLHRLAAEGLEPGDIDDGRTPFARRLTRESLRYLYRILFLLYAEARPELGILPADDGSYEAGYSMARLRELVARDEQLVDPAARDGFHLHQSLDVLFNKVNHGHREYGSEPDDELPGDDEDTRKAKQKRRSEDRGLRFEPLRSELFEPKSVKLIGLYTFDPRADDDNPAWLDLRLRNAALHEVLRLLTMKDARKGERGGFISYRNLGINQLGAVYEGLMSYTGFIAEEELYEVAKGGDAKDGSWMIPASRQGDYPDEVFVQYDERDAKKGLRGRKKYARGSFVYRLAGRDRQTSASYYTPESLTKVTVELTLKHRLDQEKDADGNVVRTRASELLKYRICEPALGSGAFLNEAINQVAKEYLRRRQEELGTTIPTSQALAEEQKAKAYIALHNAYGVDLNATGVELAEVSLWLNTMHPGMRAPWFGLHLRRGNSLIGGRRAVFDGDVVGGKEKLWLKSKGALGPTPLPFHGGDGERQELPDGAVHQFLLPAVGWAAVASEKEAKALAPEQARRLAAWKKGILKPPAVKAARGQKLSQLARLQAVARRAEFLWELVVRRMEISESEISRRVTVWGAEATPGEDAEEYAFLRRPEGAVSKEKVYKDLFDSPGTPYWRLKTMMDAWCALWFWPVDQAELLDGSAAVYVEETGGGVSAVESVLAVLPQVGEPVVEAGWVVAEQTSLFAAGAEQESLFAGLADSAPVSTGGSSAPGVRRGRRPAPRRRNTIALADFADWLDFAEALLGTYDAPTDSLIGDLRDLEDVSTFEDGLPAFMGMDSVWKLEERFPWLATVQRIAEEQGFLHWELDFALVFAQGGGFDLQVGNPPWVRPRWDEAGVLAEHEPWFKLTEKASTAEKQRRKDDLLRTPAARSWVLDELISLSAQVALFGSEQFYPLLTGTQPDLYRAFMHQVWAHSSVAGTAGMVHPDTHFTGEKEGVLREAAYRRLRVHGDFVNSGQRFFPRPVGDTSHFGVHVYGAPGGIDFDHLSWLVSVDALRLSAKHDGTGDAPGVRYRNGEFDERPHLARVVRVNYDQLAMWQQLLDEQGQPVEQGKLLFPVSTAEAAAIEALAGYPLRLGTFGPQISAGYHESSAREIGLIDYNRPAGPEEASFHPDRWRQVILKGAQFSVATPVFKRHDANSNDAFGADLVALADEFVPDTAYVRMRGKTGEYLTAQDRWIDHRVLARLRASADARDAAKNAVSAQTGASPERVTAEQIDIFLIGRARRRFTIFNRLAWRRQIAPNTERALYAALVPPGSAHIHAVHSLAMPDDRLTALAAGFWASLPLDYLLRATGRSDLVVKGPKAMPAPAPGHPLASALLLRTLRLNCLTRAYSDLWAELYDRTWPGYEPWACDWPELQPLHEVTPQWQSDTPLRTERARRSALVEIDALVAVWLGMDADALIAAYRGRFPVLQKYEAVTWFDVEGRKLAGNARTIGQYQGKESFAQLTAHLADPDNAPVPDGYRAPFYKADREREMREAHAVFQARLDAAVARGEWDPVKQEDPRTAGSAARNEGQEAS